MTPSPCCREEPQHAGPPPYPSAASPEPWDSGSLGAGQSVLWGEGGEGDGDLVLETGAKALWRHHSQPRRDPASASPPVEFPEFPLQGDILVPCEMHSFA